ncbi:MAG: hypothetical protein ACFCGT_17510 [Sandaracinaceae bacterium]
MKARYVSFVIISVSLAVLTGCGTAPTPPPAEAPRAEAGGEAAQASRWSPGLLEKLDRSLRTVLQDGHEGPFAVKVEFQRIPAEAVLAELLLRRIGSQVVGEVFPEALYRIAARADVERIEALISPRYD